MDSAETVEQVIAYEELEYDGCMVIKWHKIKLEI